MINDRAVPGRWEDDLRIDKKNVTAIGILVERSTGSRCWCTYSTARSLIRLRGGQSWAGDRA